VENDAYDLVVDKVNKLRSVPVFVLFRQMLHRLNISAEATIVHTRLLKVWTSTNLTLNDSLSYMPKESWTSSALSKEVTRFVRMNVGFAVFYTDGSRINGRTAGGAVRASDGTSISGRLHDVCSVFTAEIVAIERTIRHCVRKGIKHTLIFTDSLSSVRCLKDRKPVNAIAQKIYRKMLRRPEFTVKIIWIPAHLGIEGNDMADELAKQATEESECYGLPLIQDVINLAENRLNEEWQQWWTDINTTSGQIVKTRSIKNTVNKWRVTTFKDRETSYKITRIRLGHTRFSHDHVFTRDERRLCCCGEVLTVDHVLRLCILFEDARDKHEVNMASLDGQQRDIDNIVAFFKEVNLWQDV
jgi:ribonuclease HI